jgi:hypothetical protein
MQPQHLCVDQTGSHHSAAITVSGALLVFGRNKHGQVRPCIGAQLMTADAGLHLQHGTLHQPSAWQ